MGLLTGRDLYLAMLAHSGGSERYWIASPYLGRDAHNIFDQGFANAKDVRLLIDIKAGAVDREELKYVHGRIGKARARSLRGLHAKIYIFDNACIVTSANLSLRAFERNHEVGSVVTGASGMRQIRKVFTSLWKDASPITVGQIDKLPSKRNWGFRGAGTADGLAAHTDVALWDPLNRTAKTDDSSPGGEAPKNAVKEPSALTAEMDGDIPPRRAQRIEEYLRSRKFQPYTYFDTGNGLKTTRRQYPIGALFDCSRVNGSKRVAWANKAMRSLCRVLEVFSVSGRSVVVSRVLTSYTVDGVIRRAAKKYYVYQGKPRALDIHAYLAMVRKRKRANAASASRRQLSS